MLISSRNLLVGLSVIVTTLGVLLLLRDQTNWLVWVIIACGIISITALSLWPDRLPTLAKESEDITETSEELRRELVRGTSLYLRELRYRYSVRFDPSDAGERKAFSAEVNTIKLGFV